ncbi:hypothetical protein [Yersinia pekkanenii]|nr:hypothetical protein [Yersinia pekkanenii]
MVMAGNDGVNQRPAVVDKFFYFAFAGSVIIHSAPPAAEGQMKKQVWE